MQMTIEAAADAGIVAVIQPGGSRRDQEVIDELRAVLKQGKKGDILKDAALALGLLGQRSAAGELARVLKERRRELLAEEKALTQARERVAAKRRALPWRRDRD